MKKILVLSLVILGLVQGCGKKSKSSSSDEKRQDGNVNIGSLVLNLDDALAVAIHSSESGFRLNAEEGGITKVLSDFTQETELEEVKVLDMLKVPGSDDVVFALQNAVVKKKKTDLGLLSLNADEDEEDTEETLCGLAKLKPDGSFHCMVSGFTPLEIGNRHLAIDKDSGSVFAYLKENDLILNPGVPAQILAMVKDEDVVPISSEKQNVGQVYGFWEGKILANIGNETNASIKALDQNGQITLGRNIYPIPMPNGELHFCNADRRMMKYGATESHLEDECYVQSHALLDNGTVMLLSAEKILNYNGSVLETVATLPTGMVNAKIATHGNIAAFFDGIEAFILDESGALNKIADSVEILNASFSGDGQKLIFSGLKNGAPVNGEVSIQTGEVKTSPAEAKYQVFEVLK